MVIPVKTPVKIRVDISTRRALLALGRKGESYDAVIRRLIRETHPDVNPEKWDEFWRTLGYEVEVRE